MFIQPVSITASLNQPSEWSDHANNQYFLLQSAISNVPGLTSIWSGINSAAQMALGRSARRTIVDFKFRILFKGNTQLSVVSVGDTFKEVHCDWQWIEQHMFRYLCDKTALLMLSL
jgi:hypothetical protein